MANQDHINKLLLGYDVWNNWRYDNPEILPDLSQLDLSNKDLSNYNLNRAHLSQSNLFQANLSSADLTDARVVNAELSKSNLSESILASANLIGSNFTDAIFFNAELKMADFSTCNLARADFTNAVLFKTNFREANLSEAILSNAQLGYTVFADSNLLGAKCLETCMHSCWSILDHQTLSKSGKLSLEFLRGCGLPDFIIENINVLQESPIQFYTLFISFSVKDKDFADRIYADLQNAGIRCWYAPEDVQSGKKLYEQINDAIRLHDKLLLVLSESSMKSNWVATEIIKARENELKKGKQVLFPISITPFERIKEWKLFDNDEARDIAKEIREYYIPDFSNWKDHDNYKTTISDLISDLKM